MKDWEYALCLYLDHAAFLYRRLAAAKAHDASVRFPTAIPMLQIAYETNDMDVWTKEVVQTILTSARRLQIQAYPEHVSQEARENVGDALIALHAAGHSHILFEKEELDASARRRRVHVLL